MRWVYTDHSWTVGECLTIALEECWVCLRVGQGDGSYSVLDVAGPGDVVSPLHALAPEPPPWLGPTAPIRAHVLTKGRILQIPREVIPGVKRAPAVQQLLTIFSGEHQHALASLHTSGRLDVATRLARLLLHVRRRFGERPTPHGPALAPPLSQADLAAWIGASPSAVARTLASWRTQHVIETGYSLIRILHPKALLTLASYPPCEDQAGPLWRAFTPPALTEQGVLGDDADLPPGLQL
ncbi:Crp/Fnr family transcriptional regulator [Nonomuraea sp. NPDC048916]|uniref:Crp/Fnr family transcriptional regulator n=1 Tax=Nonomuraea sp. NPDC048916 TaxID=3154232 RepID=UPI0033DE7395